MTLCINLCAAALGLLSCIVMMFVISPQYAGITIGENCGVGINIVFLAGMTLKLTITKCICITFQVPIWNLSPLPTNVIFEISILLD